VGDVVGPACGLLRVLLALGLDDQKMTFAGSGVQLEEGVHPPFQRFDLGEVGGHEGHRDRVREGEIKGPEGPRERAGVLLENAVHRLVG
jgi:hypothetical protein